MTNKFTIEISDEALGLINSLKKDNATVEEVLADMVDIGLQEIGRARLDAMRESIKGTPLAAMLEGIEELLEKIKSRPSDEESSEDPTTRKMREAMEGVPVMGIGISKEDGIIGLENLPEPIREAIEKLRPSIMNALENGGDVRAILAEGLSGAAGVMSARDVFGDVCDCKKCVARRETEVKITPLSATKS